ncbi:YfhO family protein [Flagellimonas lutaonensis]|uniref:Membrane protein n=1 Tax=Flagellimonas lutaonensis TaxID=516051 RepID=A0A0D5YV72_9FLAO|nr:YfhO family protein [Allomuricauda lutaonensis]AKA36217.1 membrane protein [Allomuricauda lutaonensis]
MKLSAKAIFTHLIVIVLFVLASTVYFYPVLQGKAIFQSDIAQYKGMAKERDDFKKNTGIESYWTNSAFGGMPTYQLGANYPHDYVKKLDRLIRFLPRPADYLFLYLLGFYVLMLCMKAKWRWAVLGALAFGFSTYLIIILGVGHNAKAHALGYIPFLLGGIILVFRKKYILGFLLTALAMALEISANHYQMTYYFMLLVLVMGAVYLIYAIKEKELKHFFVSVGILVGAVVLGVATNATGLMATKEYADWSTRGKSELTINPDGSPKEVKDGLDKEYITQYSYGILESLNLFVPRLFGGSNSENLGKDSKAYAFLTEQGLPPSRALEFTGGLPLYWGKQPIVAAPAYVGAVVFFLFVLGLFLVKAKHKWWLVAGVLLSLLLSWGKNFPALTNFMIDYFPLYNKFRAVSSVQVVLELCIPVLGILGLMQLAKKKVKTTEKMRALKWSTFITVGLCVAIFLMKGFFDFEGLNDDSYRRYFGDELMAMVQSDREAVYVNDTLRTLIFVLLTALALWFFIKDKINKNILALALGALLLIDLVGVNLRYVNADDFVRQRVVNNPFQPSEADKQIMQDPGVFRVFDPNEGLNGARTSFFHHSIGGYHAAKPRAMQDLFEFHIYKNNLQVLNMLNVKYIMQQDEEGRTYAALNENANGNAWFVENIKAVKSPDEAIQALGDIDTKKTAVVNTQKYPWLVKTSYGVDSTATIQLIEYRPDYLKYRSSNPNEGFAVFSEMFYPHGWNAYLDGKPTDHYRVNYALRGMKIPAGEHEIEFRFEPKVVETGSKIALGSNILLGLLFLLGLLYLFWPKREKTKT